MTDNEQAIVIAADHALAHLDEAIAVLKGLADTVRVSKGRTERGKVGPYAATLREMLAEELIGHDLIIDANDHVKLLIAALEAVQEQS